MVGKFFSHAEELNSRVPAHIKPRRWLQVGIFKETARLDAVGCKTHRQNFLLWRGFTLPFCAPAGLVAQLVEQCPFNSKTPILAIFIRFYPPFAIIAELLISLGDCDVLLLSLVLPQNPIFFIRVTSRVQVFRVQVFLCHLNRVDS
jgi:hypothetical protein